MKPFPLAVAAVFVVLALGSLVILATYTSSRGSAVGQVVIWGSVPADSMQPAFDAIQTDNSTYNGMTYQYAPKNELIPKLVAAIAAGRGPDLVIFPGEYLLSQGDKLLLIPYDSFSRRDFQDTFVEAGEIFLGNEGTLGLPFSIDPLVMYWNRSLFSAAGVSQAPKYWDEVNTIAPKLSASDGKGTLTRSAVAFGTWDNVANAKGVFVSLLKELGNQIVVKGDKGYRVVLVDSTAGAASAADSALRFYTDFADPVKPLYSWNRSQENSRDAFIAGKLAIYVGRSSELFGIRAQNPNLNFDVAALPSIRGGGASVEAAVTALSVPRGSRNPKGAFLVAQALTSASAQSALQKSLHTPSVRRDSQQSSTQDPYFVVFQNAALSAFAFLDPDPTASDAVFKRMTEDVSSGAVTVSEAVSRAGSGLSSLIINR